MSNGQSVPLQPVMLEQGSGLENSHVGWWKDWHQGAMDGFAHQATGYPDPSLAYGYVPKAETVPYWSLAQTYTFGNHMFQPNAGPSFPSHQYLIAGTIRQYRREPNRHAVGMRCPAFGDS